MLEPDQDTKSDPRLQNVKSIDMKAIISKASAKFNLSTKHRLHLSHLSDTRCKYDREIEESKQEQVKKSLLKMQKHIRQEQDRIFVERAAYDEVLHDANHFTSIANSRHAYRFPEELAKLGEDWAPDNLYQ